MVEAKRVLLLFFVFFCHFKHVLHKIKYFPPVNAVQKPVSVCSPESEARRARAHESTSASTGLRVTHCTRKVGTLHKSNRNYIFTFSSLSKSPFQRRNEREIHLIYFILSIYNIYLFLYNTLFFILYGYRFLLWGSDVIHVKQRFPLMHLSRDVRNIFILTLTL